jgi:hypothetical protein
MTTSVRSVCVASALAAFFVGFVPPLGAERPAWAAGTSLCAGGAAIARLETQARSAAAAGDLRQFGLWKEAAEAAAECAQNAGGDARGDARGWYAYVQASDEFLALPGETQILASAPAILAEIDALIGTEKNAAVVQAARSLRDDVARAYRQTRDIVLARATPVATPEPTISPWLLRVRGPLGM